MSCSKIIINNKELEIYEIETHFPEPMWYSDENGNRIYTENKRKVEYYYVTTIFEESVYDFILDNMGLEIDIVIKLEKIEKKFKGYIDFLQEEGLFMKFGLRPNREIKTTKIKERKKK